LSSICV